MLNWLNANAGAVMASLTLVYVIATLVLVLLGWRNLRTLTDLERRRSQPHVVFDLVIRQNAVYAVITNIGLTTARDVCVTIQPQLQHGDRISPLTSHPIAHLAPGREVTDLIAAAPAFYQSYPRPRFVGHVTYSDPDGRTLGKDFTIDLEFRKDLHRVSTPDIGEELKKIREALEAMASRGPTTED